VVALVSAALTASCPRLHHHQHRRSGPGARQPQRRAPPNTCPENTDAHPRIGQRAAQTAWEPTRPPYLGLLPKSSPRSSSAVALAGDCVTAEACTVTRSTRSSFRRSYPKLSAHANAECHIMRGQSRSWASSKRVQNGVTCALGADQRQFHSVTRFLVRRRAERRFRAADCRVCCPGVCALIGPFCAGAVSACRPAVAGSLRRDSSQ